MTIAKRRGEAAPRKKARRKDAFEIYLMSECIRAKFMSRKATELNFPISANAYRCGMWEAFYDALEKYRAFKRRKK